MGGTRPARDRYTVAIAPHRPGTFLTPFPLPLAFESPPDARYGGDVVLSAWLTPRPHGHALAGATGINPRRVNAPGLASRSLRPRDSVVPRLRTLSVATYTLRMRFSVGAYPSFSPFSQTISCKKGVSPGPALHCARHTAGVHPTARVKRGDPLAGVQSVRHTLFLFPPLSTKSPIIPSLCHCHPTIASTVLQQPWGEAERRQPSDMGGALVVFFLLFFG